jgi:hypothetical protein
VTSLQETDIFTEVVNNSINHSWQNQKTKHNNKRYEQPKQQY